MKNITKLTSTYPYPAKGRGEPAIEVGFFLDSRLDRFGNVLRKVNITDKFGQIHSIDYSGKSLMLSVKTGHKTTSVRRATREDLVKYKEAYASYLSDLSLEDKKLQEEKLYLFLEELPPIEESKPIIESKNDELEALKAELEKAKAELEKAKTKPAKKVKTEESEKTE